MRNLCNIKFCRHDILICYTSAEDGVVGHSFSAVTSFRVKLPEYELSLEMPLPSLFVLLVYISGYMFLVFAAICLMCGIYYLVELAEEYTTITKELIRCAALAQLLVHTLLFIYERFPFVPTAVGFVSHLSYLQLLRVFPFINPFSLPVAAASIFFVLDNIFWFRFFHYDVELFYRYRVAPTPAIASFFLLVVWLVPLGFFITLSVNDSVLPNVTFNGAQNRGSRPSSPVVGDAKKRSSRNLIIVCVDAIVGAARRAIDSTMRKFRHSDILTAVGRRNF